MVEEKEQPSAQMQESIEKLEQQPEQAQPTQEQVSKRDMNFRKLEEEKRQLEREKQQLMQMIAQQQKPQPTTQEEQFNPNPDDLVEWKVVNRELKKVREELNQYKKQSYESMVETRLKTNYSDFDKVVTPENIERLKEEYPDLHRTISNSPDMYDQFSSAYTVMKKMGIYKDNTYDLDKTKAQANVAKPKPASLVSPSYGSAALGEAASHDLKVTPDVRERLYKEMLASSKKAY